MSDAAGTDDAGGFLIANLLFYPLAFFVSAALTAFVGAAIIQRLPHIGG